ncbi:hypothetical protein H310_00244 [Aphanomyces invadans]|uniref:Uncharacterized protein n=1 Tax=Aphanomyces invadans TaxID=157072 RepID=A0A024UTS3_9STRA|nr:hypothetical protein H310_00244 [Aphanomyces invadans]ETW09759.1 hypothetical protein H310_00244 [Aphanomyces invadans]|eukprot:XP_008861170.1 hypothetical protein H310_00244 [Aphanomyces invadans]
MRPLAAAQAQGEPTHTRSKTFTTVTSDRVTTVGSGAPCHRPILVHERPQMPLDVLIETHPLQDLSKQRVRHSLLALVGHARYQDTGRTFLNLCLQVACPAIVAVSVTTSHDGNTGPIHSVAADRAYTVLVGTQLQFVGMLSSVRLQEHERRLRRIIPILHSVFAPTISSKQDDGNVFGHL